MYLSGIGDGNEVLATIDERLGGEGWFSGSHTAITATGEFGAGPGAFSSERGLNGAAAGEGQSDNGARVSFTLSTFGLDQEQFDRIRDDWFEWWQGVAENGELTSADSAPDSGWRNPLNTGSSEFPESRSHGCRRRAVPREASPALTPSNRFPSIDRGPESGSRLPLDLRVGA
ncbi:MAG: hypothetical protein JJE10_11495 [Thermoleophilia bacterium]|nr:hypothetical protein [Thermoleophilia bacterium]